MSEHDGGSGRNQVRRYLEGTAYLRARSQVARIVRSYHVPSADQEDLLQTVLADACRALVQPGFTLRTDFGRLLRTLAHRRCIDYGRRRRVMVPLDPEQSDTAPHPDGKIDANERIDLATEIMRRVPTTARELFTKVIFEGRSYAEIATATGRSEGALRVEMCTSLKRARVVAKEVLRSLRRIPADEDGER